MSFEHAVHDHHRDERLRPLMQDGHVLAADVLATAHPVACGGPTGVGRMASSCSGEPPTWRRNGVVGSASFAQNGARSTWPGDRSPAGSVRHPDRFEPGVDREVQLGQRKFGILQRHDADAIKRSSAAQNSLIARLCARVAP